MLHVCCLQTPAFSPTLPFSDSPEVQRGSDANPVVTAGVVISGGSAVASHPSDSFASAERSGQDDTFNFDVGRPSEASGVTRITPSTARRLPGSGYVHTPVIEDAAGVARGAISAFQLQQQQQLVNSSGTTVLPPVVNVSDGPGSRRSVQIVHTVHFDPPGTRDCTAVFQLVFPFTSEMVL